MKKCFGCKKSKGKMILFTDTITRKTHLWHTKCADKFTNLDLVKKIEYLNKEVREDDK